MNDSVYEFQEKDALTFKAKLFDNKIQDITGFIIPTTTFKVNGVRVDLGEPNVLAIIGFGRVQVLSPRRQYLLFFPSTGALANCTPTGCIAPYTAMYSNLPASEARYAITIDACKYFCSPSSLQAAHAAALSKMKSLTLMVTSASINKKFELKNGSFCTILRMVKADRAEYALFVGMIEDADLQPPFTCRVYDAAGRVVDDESDTYRIVGQAMTNYVVVVQLDDGVPVEAAIKQRDAVDFNNINMSPHMFKILEFTAKSK